NRTVEETGIACKLSGPGAMAENDDRTSAGLIVRWQERAAARGADAEDVKEVSGDQRACHPAAVDPTVEVRRLREGIGEHADVSHERFVLRPRKTSGLRVGRSLTFDGEQLVRIANLVDAKDEGVEDGECDGHQPEAEADRRHDRQGDQRGPAERAAGIADVAYDLVQ